MMIAKHNINNMNYNIDDNKIQLVGNNTDHFIGNNMCNEHENKMKESLILLMKKYNIDDYIFNEISFEHATVSIIIIINGIVIKWYNRRNDLCNICINDKHFEYLSFHHFQGEYNVLCEHICFTYDDYMADIFYDTFDLILNMQSLNYNFVI